MKKLKGKVTRTGYKSNSPDKGNDFNVVPSNHITMKGVNKNLMLIPMRQGGGYGQPVVANPGGEYYFPNYTSVLEIPYMQAGGQIPYEDSLALYNLTSKWNTILDTAGNYENTRKRAEKFYSTPEGSKLNELATKYNININDPSRVVKSPVKDGVDYTYARYNKPIPPAPPVVEVQQMVPAVNNQQQQIDPNWQFKAKKFQGFVQNTVPTSMQVPGYSVDDFNQGANSGSMASMRRGGQPCYDCGGMYKNYQSGGSMSIPAGYHVMSDGSIMANAEMNYTSAKMNNAAAAAIAMPVPSKDLYPSNPPMILNKKGQMVPNPLYKQYKGGGNWIQNAVNPKHKGYCSPMTKKTCTPRRKAFAMTMKKHHGFHKEYGGEPEQNNVNDYLSDKRQGFLKFIGQNTMRHIINEERDLVNEFQEGGVPGQNTVFNPYEISPFQQNPPVTDEYLQQPADIQVQSFNPNFDTSIESAPEMKNQNDQNNMQIEFGYNPQTAANAILATTGMIGNLLERSDRKKQEQEMKKKYTADSIFSSTPYGLSGQRGDYTVNSGNFRPDDKTPVQFSGYNYKKGGPIPHNKPVYLSQAEIDQILKSGGEIEFLD